MSSIASDRSINSNTVLYDITALITTPLRTGIQRVTFEIIRNWPRPLELVPVMVTESGELIRLHGKTFELIGNFFCDSGQNQPVKPEQITALARQPIARLGNDKIARCKALFNPELFLGRPRLAFYERLLDEGLSNIFFIVYDALPVIHPQLFPRPFAIVFNEYARLLRRVPNLAFISEITRREFTERILRLTQVGHVLPLGSDGLGSSKPNFSCARKQFTVVGSLEPRKNHLQILAAFEDLWEHGIDVKLTFVGRRAWLSDVDFQRILSLSKSQPHFQWLSDLKDTQAASSICQSRATIFVSEIEGYGLPPMESLALGVPVIVSEKIPSVQMIEPLGQIRLHDVNPETISEAVMQMLDNDFAAKKYNEIKSLELPKWKDLSKGAHGWIVKDT